MWYCDLSVLDPLSQFTGQVFVAVGLKDRCNPATDVADEIRSVASFTSSASTSPSLATENRNREETTFLRIAIWGKAGEAAAEHLVKGQRIAASGRIEAKSWTDDEGTRRQTWTLTADTTEWLHKPRSAQTDHSKPSRQTKAEAAAEAGEEPF